MTFRFRFRLRGRSIYFKIVALIAAIIIVSVVLLSSITYKIAADTSIANSIASNRAMLTQQRTMIDNELASIRNISLTILMTQSYMFRTWRDEIAVSTVIDLTRYLDQQRQLNPYIESIYVYYDEFEQIMTSQADAKSSKIGEFPDRHWLPYVFESAGDKQRALWVANRESAADGEADPPRVASLIQKIPLIGAPYGAIVINVDQDKLLEDFVAPNRDLLGETIVLDRSDRPVWIRDGAMSTSFLQSGIRIGAERQGEARTVTLGGEEAILTYTVSEETGWKFIHLTPKRQLLQSMQSIKILVLSVSVLYIAAAILFASYLSRRIYSPLKTAIERLGGVASDSGYRNEAAIIEETYDRMARSHADLLEQKTHIENVLARHGEAFKEKLLQDLVTGNGGDWSAPGFDGLALRLPQGHFVVVAAEPFENAADNEKSDPMRLQLLKYGMMDDIRQLAGGEAFPMDGDKIAAIVPSEGEDEESVLAMIKTFKQQVETRYGVLLSVGCSNIRSEREHIPEAHAEAREALNYKVYVGRGEILSYRSIVAWKAAEQTFYYPYALEKRLLLSVNQGDGAAVEAAIQELARTILDRKLSATNIHHLFIQLSGEIIKSAVSAGESIGEVLGEDFSYLKEVARVQTISDIERFLAAVCKKVIEHGNRKTLKIYDDTLNKAIQYMEANYNNSISVESIAEHVHLSASYIGRMFKERMGVTLNEYLIDLRINRAKQLLAETDLTIDEICQQVGYSTISYFTKLFKGRTGMTPGTYRRERLLNDR